jgi:hypothetical protein
MTTTTEALLVDDVVYSVSEVVKCSFYNCQNIESALIFDSNFFDSRTAFDSDNNWSRYLDSLSEARIFNTEVEAEDFKKSLSDSVFSLRVDELAVGFTVRWWSRHLLYFCPDHSASCMGCDDYLSINYATVIDSDYYCDDCRDNNFHYCDHCSEWCSEVNDVEGDWFCNYCVNSVGAQYCDHCDMYERHLCDLNYEPEDIDIWNSRNYEGVMSYNFKPSKPDFFMGSIDSDNLRLFYGVELEVESMDNSFSDGMEIVKESLAELVYFKADGSLDRGYELVTYPFSFNYYSEAFDFKFLSRLQALGYRSWSAGTCGLHVHIRMQ